MSENSANGIRRKFIQYFEDHNHEYYHSCPVVLPTDQTLLFVNAGMNQFKSLFTGEAERSTSLGKLKRAVNSQKCIRAGGKHNDLDDVGKDVYHHTFFEMLGNWSFGDYFKETAIDLAWNFLTNEMKLDKTRLYATYFENDNGDDKVPTDVETFDIWKKYLPSDHIITGSFKDNFWEMGETGPCGPCTEIHYDRIGNRNASDFVNKDDPNVLEVWNIVFIQYDRQEDKSLKPLPNKHVDTGMGLERLVSIIQNKMSNYDTDIFMPIIEHIYSLCNIDQKYRGRILDQDENNIDQAYRVVADHCRTLVIAISDGVMPSNTGRGYVIRRILRRAVRYAFEKLKAEPGCISKIALFVAELLEPAFPEIKLSISTIKNVIDSEESKFLSTMSKGKKFFENAVLSLQQSNILSGDFVWKLYDTYGYPVDLTQLMCDERNIKIDYDGLEKAKLNSLVQSKRRILNNNNNGHISKTNANPNEIIHKLSKFDSTDDQMKYKCYKWDDETSEYKCDHIDAKLIAILNESQLIVQEASENENLSIVLDRTCFYSESGGQIGDVGFIRNDDFEFEVLDTQKYKNDNHVFVLHIGRLLKGNLKVNQDVKCFVNSQFRSAVMKNHTATHIINLALRERFGVSLTQKGSLVNQEKLRFDFSCIEMPSIEDIKLIESISNEYINDAHQIITEFVSIEKAMKIENIRTMPDESYPSTVRVVQLGDKVPSERNYKSLSIELCGGTHLCNTDKCQKLCILSCEPLAHGIKRLNAITGQAAINAFDKMNEIEREILAMTNSDENHKINSYLELLDQITIPWWSREQLKKRLNSIKMAVSKMNKLQIQSKIDNLIKIIDEKILSNKVDALIAVVPFEDNRKAISNVLSKLKRHELPMVFLSNGSKSIICLANTPSKQNSISAIKCMSAISDHFQHSKTGGSDLNAQLCIDNNKYHLKDVVETSTKVISDMLSCTLDNILVISSE